MHQKEEAPLTLRTPRTEELPADYALLECERCGLMAIRPPDYDGHPAICFGCQQKETRDGGKVRSENQ